MKKQILVIFGGGGDLAKRKLLPALYHLAHVGLLDNLDRIIGIGRTVMSRDDYLNLMHIALKEHVDSNNWNNATWRIFAEHLEYYCVDALKSDNYAILSDTIGANHSAVFYLATLPSLYGAICKNLEAGHLVNDESRVVLEKPLGNDEYLLTESDAKGVFNGTAPQPVTNGEFSQCLAKLLNRPALLPAPALVLKLALGEMATLLLGGQRVVPQRFIDAEFQFHFKTLEAALCEAIEK